jgi:predicted phage replisome organizer
LAFAGKSNNNGVFMLSNRIPYTEEMLSTLFRRPLNTVRLALQTFEQFGMIEYMNGVLTLPNWEKHQNIDGMDKIREQNRNRKRLQRERQRQALPPADCHVTVTGSHATDKEKDKDKEQEKEYLPTEEEETHVREAVSVSEIVNLYHTICVSFPKVQSISDKRRKAINARLKAYTAEQFSEMFKKAENSSFLKGANDRNWTATFDWLIADSNFAKVLDGNYDDKEPKSAAEKPKKTRFAPNPTRDTSESFDISAAIMEAEMKGRTEEEERWIERSMNAIDEALERGKA